MSDGTASPEEIVLLESGTRIGYVKRWMNGEETWNGLIYQTIPPDGENASLGGLPVCNDPSRFWARYQVIRLFQVSLLDSPDRPTGKEARLILECFDAMKVEMKAHLDSLRAAV